MEANSFSAWEGLGLKAETGRLAKYSTLDNEPGAVGAGELQGSSVVQVVLELWFVCGWSLSSLENYVWLQKRLESLCVFYLWACSKWKLSSQFLWMCFVRAYSWSINLNFRVARAFIEKYNRHILHFFFFFKLINLSQVEDSTMLWWFVIHESMISHKYTHVSSWNPYHLP